MALKKFLFQNQSIKQSLIKNTIWLWIGQISSQLIRMLVIIYAARILGAEGYGAFAYTISLAGFFIIFSDIGVNTILTRDSAKHPKLRQQYIATIFLIKLILVVFSFLLLIATGSLIIKISASKGILPLVALIFAFDALKDFGIAIARSLERMEIEALIAISGSLILASFVLILLPVSATPQNLAHAYLIGSSFSFLIIIIFARKYFKNLLSNFRAKLVKPILFSSVPLALSSLFGSIVIYGDTIILGWFKSASEVGLYSVAQRPIQMLYLISGIAASSVLPVISRLVKTNSNKLKILLEKTNGVIMLIGIPIVIGGALLSEELIVFLFGQEYLASSAVFKILIFSLLFIYPSHILINLITAYNRQKEIIKYWIFSAIAIIIASLILIPPLGIIGAAIAALLSRAIGNTLTFSKARQIKNFSFFSKLKKIILATFIMSLGIILLLYLNMPFIIILLFSIVIYFCALIILKEALLKEISLFSKA